MFVNYLDSDIIESIFEENSLAEQGPVTPPRPNDAKSVDVPNVSSFGGSSVFSTTSLS
jgi:hypothetical protein